MYRHLFLAWFSGVLLVGGVATAQEAPAAAEDQAEQDSAVREFVDKYYRHLFQSMAGDDDKIAFKEIEANRGKWKEWTLGLSQIKYAIAVDKGKDQLLTWDEARKLQEKRRVWLAVKYLNGYRSLGRAIKDKKNPTAFQRLRDIKDIQKALVPAWLRRFREHQGDVTKVVPDSESLQLELKGIHKQVLDACAKIDEQPEKLRKQLMEEQHDEAHQTWAAIAPNLASLAVIQLSDLEEAKKVRDKARAERAKKRAEREKKRQAKKEAEARRKRE